MNDVITLIAERRHTDKFGDAKIIEEKTTIYADVASVGYREFYEANALGLKPEIKFIIADYYDYDLQHIVEYNGTRYNVLRSYRVGQRLELTCTTEVNDERS